MLSLTQSVDEFLEKCTAENKYLIWNKAGVNINEMDRRLFRR